MLYESSLKHLIKRLTEQQLLEWIEDIKADRDFLHEELKVMYEWEYKYSQLKQGINLKNEKRIENTLKQIHIRLNPIFQSIANKLIIVFNSWLDKHNIDKPEIWAKARYDDNEGEGILYNIKDDYARYAEEEDFYEEAFQAVYTLYEADFNERLDEVVDGYRYQAEEAEEIGDEDEAKKWNDLAEETESLNMKKYDDIIVFMENYAYETTQEFLEAHGDDEIMLVTLYEEVLFPVWFAHWKEEGMLKARKNIQTSLKELNKVKTEKDFSKKIVILNIALNVSHTTGSMLNDYIDPMYGVDKKDLDKLSNVNKGTLASWNKEVGMAL